MASRSTAAWLMASLLAIACSFHKNGLASNGDEMDGGGGPRRHPGAPADGTGAVWNHHPVLSVDGRVRARRTGGSLGPGWAACWSSTPRRAASLPPDAR
jgi:hypothetical protein